MKKKFFPYKILFKLCMALLLIVEICAACNLQYGNRPKVWIDIPQPGSIIQAGQRVILQAHAYAPGGVAETLFSVNGMPYRREPPQDPQSEFSPISEEWLADEPGEYFLQIEVFDNNGRGSSPVGVWVQVISVEVAVEENAPPTETTSSLPLPSKSPIQPTVTFTTTPTLTSTPLPPTPTSMPIPTSTSTPQPPTDSSPPSIGAVSESADPIFKPFCEPNTLTISAQVTDPGGISKVKITYRVVEGSRQGQWKTLKMNHASGNTYRLTMGWEDFEASLDPPVNSKAKIEYFIQAWDSYDNKNQSGTNSTTLENCLL